jgi:hypothetical protein
MTYEVQSSKSEQLIPDKAAITALIEQFERQEAEARREAEAQALDRLAEDFARSGQGAAADAIRKKARTLRNPT